MKLLFLCPRKEYIEKLGRIRFHTMAAIGKKAEVIWSGKGWDNYEDNQSVGYNIKKVYSNEKPDLIVVFMPEQMHGWKDIAVPVCIRENELMTNQGFDEEQKAYRLSQINDCGINLVIFHHLNDMKTWTEILKDKISPGFQIANISHCAEQTIFKDYGLPKKYDLLLVGWRNIFYLNSRYPLRKRFAKIFSKMRKWKCHIYKHPGYVHSDAFTDKYAIEYAKMINSAKICCACSGKPQSRYVKYVEIPMCGAAFAADLPGECHDFFRQFLIEVDMSMTDDEIIQKLEYYLTHDEERERLAQRGTELAKDYTDEKYAERFLKIAGNFLENWRQFNVHKINCRTTYGQIRGFKF